MYSAIPFKAFLIISFLHILLLLWLTISSSSTSYIKHATASAVYILCYTLIIYLSVVTRSLFDKTLQSSNEPITSVGQISI